MLIVMICNDDVHGLHDNDLHVHDEDGAVGDDVDEGDGDEADGDISMSNIST